MVVALTVRSVNPGIPQTIRATAERQIQGLRRWEATLLPASRGLDRSTQSVHRGILRSLTQTKEHPAYDSTFPGAVTHWASSMTLRGGLGVEASPTSLWFYTRVREIRPLILGGPIQGQTNKPSIPRHKETHSKVQAPYHHHYYSINPNHDTRT